MHGQDRIEKLFAYIVVDTDGTEGIPAMSHDGFLIPLTGADTTRAVALLPVALATALQQGKSVELVHFGHRQHVEWIDPPSGPQRPPEPTGPEAGPFLAAHTSVPYTTFPEPQIAPEKVVHAEGVWVAGTLVDGKPGIAISFCVDGEWQPPFVVADRVAEDLCILDSDALDAVRRMAN